MPDAGEGAQTDLGLRAAGTAQAQRGSRCAPDGCGRRRPLPGHAPAAWRAQARRCKPQVPAAVRRLPPTETPVSARQPAAKPLPAPSTRPPGAVLRQHSGAHQCVRRRGHAGHACYRRGAAEHPNAMRRPDSGARRTSFDEFPIPGRQSPIPSGTQPPGSAPHSCACCAGACAPPSSWSRKSTARRRCGITMEPPTTSPTEKVSKNSSRLTPASLHCATW